MIRYSKIHNVWHYIFTGTHDFEEKDDKIDIGKFNIYLLNEFVLESLPQMILIGINSHITGQLDAVSKLSIAVSAIIVTNGLYRLVIFSTFSYFTTCIKTLITALTIFYLFMC